MNPASRLLRSGTLLASLLPCGSVPVMRREAADGFAPAMQHLIPLLQRNLGTSLALHAARPQPQEASTAEKETHAPHVGAATSARTPEPEQNQDPPSSTSGASSSTGGSSSGQSSESSSSSSGGSGGVPRPNMLHDLAQEVRDTILPLNNLRSYIRKYKGPLAEAADGPYSGSSAITVVKQPQTPWQRAWSALHDRLGHLPLFNKLAGFRVADTSAYQKGQQLVEDLKEKYETSDHPVVHKVEEYKERVFAGSEASRAMMEIRNRDPSFDMNLFLRSIKLDAPVVTKAFLTHDMSTLLDYCGPEIMQRLEGLCKATQQQELKEDPTILFVGDVEMVELRLMENDPFVICQFHCQQLKCVRDKFGNVVEGSPDTIHRVYYFWGLQQEKHGVVTQSGELLPPRWVIKDMLWQSMLALV